jgi:O-antigen ligase/tetratricopeptide (TPR) repeat protein
MNGRPLARRPLLWIGAAGTVLVPLAFLDHVNRFALLPQILSLQLVGLVGLVAWLLSGTHWRSSRLILPVVVFCLFEALSVLAAENPVLSLLPIATHIAYVVFFLVLLNLDESEDFLRILKFACITGGMVSVIGIAQFMGLEPSWIPTAGLPSATMGHRNIAAAFLIGVLPFTCLLWQQAKRNTHIVQWGVVMGLQAAFLIATRSRGAWMGLAAASLLVLFLFFRRGGKPTLRLPVPARAASFLIVLALCVLSSAIPARIEKGSGEAMWEGKRSIGASLTSVVSEGGDKGRLALWHRTLEMIVDRPIMGVGAGNWRIVFPAYSQGDMLDPRAIPHRPHNDLLWIWAEMGTPGFLGYLYLLWVAGSMIWQLSGRNDQRPLAFALACSVAAAVVNSLFSFPREFPAAWLPFVLCLGGLGVNSGSGHKRTDRQIQTIVFGAAVLTVAGIILTIQQIGFDRHSVNYRVAFAQEKWHDIIREVDLAHAWGSFDEEAFLMRGRSYAATGRIGRAEADYKKGLAFHPNSVGLWNELGNALRQTGDPNGALRAYEHALALDPKSGMSYNNIGTMHAMSGDIDSAKAAYEQAIANQPDLADAYANLSNIHRRTGDLGASFDAASRAVELAPGNPESCNAMGSSFMAAGSFKAAEEQFALALKSDTARAEIYHNLGRAREAQGNLSGAITAYEGFFRHWQGAKTPRVQSLRRHLEALKQRD